MSYFGKRARRQLLSSGQTRALMAILVVVIVAIQLTNWVFAPKEHRFVPGPNLNALSVDPALQGAFPISITQPVELSSMSLATLSNLRKSIVESTPALTAPYSLSDEVFGRIKSEGKWMSIDGYYVGGRAQQAVNGKSFESVSILNPFILVLPEFFDLSIWSGKLKWDYKKVKRSVVLQGDFPLAPKATELTVFPSERKATVVYEVSQFVKDANSWTSVPLTAFPVTAEVLFMNAVDFGYKFAYLKIKESQGVSSEEIGNDPITLQDHYKYYKSLCGNAEGCNHRSSPHPFYDKIVFNGSGARAVFALWKSQPKSVDQEPDFRFVIETK